MVNKYKPRDSESRIYSLNFGSYGMHDFYAKSTLMFLEQGTVQRDLEAIQSAVAQVQIGPKDKESYNHCTNILHKEP
jgi:hypothetical protein